MSRDPARIATIGDRIEHVAQRVRHGWAKAVACHLCDSPLRLRARESNGACRERMLRAIAEGEGLPDLDVDAALSTLQSELYAPLLLGLGVPGEAPLDACLAICLPRHFHPATSFAR